MRELSVSKTGKGSRALRLLVSCVREELDDGGGEGVRKIMKVEKRW